MTIDKLFEIVIEKWGPLGVLLVAVAFIARVLWPRYERRTQQVIEGYEARLEDYKRQLAEAKVEIQQAAAERQDITAKFLVAMGEQIAAAKEVNAKMVIEFGELKKIVCAEVAKGKKQRRDAKAAEQP